MEPARVRQEYLFSQATKQLFNTRFNDFQARKGHGVLIIPGFLSRDRFNKPLMSFLNDQGYNATGWKNGRNLGPREQVIERLMRELDFKYQETQQKVSLIGHSLGGIYAREIAKKRPDQVEQVITLGSPFARGQNRKTMTNKLYNTINETVETAGRGSHLEIAPPVPTTCVFTRSDSVIDWRSAYQDVKKQNIEKDSSSTELENIEVYGSHCGLTLNASVWYILLDKLSKGAEGWQPFDNSGWRNTVFPNPY
jgi:pimeloyl-ACP methyl ester carboxylesterase